MAPVLSSAQDLHFRPIINRGVNLPGYFIGPDPGRIPFSPRLKDDFQNLSTLGCDVVRLPIDFSAYTDGPPAYTLDPLVFELLDQAAEWADAAGIYLIFDYHFFHERKMDNDELKLFLLSIWRQVAEYFQGIHPHAAFEILNEPDKISAGEWGEVFKLVIDEIRAVDRTRLIIVSPVQWGIPKALPGLPEFSDSNIIYTFHFYEPFLFTHQGVSWLNPSLGPLSGVPFPPSAGTPPQLPRELNGTWIEESLGWYHIQGSEEKLLAELDAAAQWAEKRNVPLFCGEFGVYNQTANPQQRHYWYEFIRKALEERNIPWTCWDYRGDFGLFNKGSRNEFPYDLDLELIESLGLNVPDIPDRQAVNAAAGIDLYDDYPGSEVRDASFIQKSELTYFNTDEPGAGEYSIQWIEPGRDIFRLTFKEPAKLQALVDRGGIFECLVKCGDPGAKITIRFLNSAEGENIPWRMTYDVGDGILAENSNWQRLQISLSAFTDSGAWKDKWYTSEDAFDWDAVDSIEIVPGFSSRKIKKIGFDELQVRAVSFE